MPTNLCVLVRVRVNVTMSERLFSCTMLAGWPRTPCTPTSVNRIGKHRTLGDFLMPMICQIIILIILFRCLRALHEKLVPPAIRLLSVQACLTAPMTITLNSRYAKRWKARCGLTKHLTLTIFAIYDNVHNLRLNDIYLEWHDLDDIISAI